MALKKMENQSCLPAMKFKVNSVDYLNLKSIEKSHDAAAYVYTYRQVHSH